MSRGREFGFAPIKANRVMPESISVSRSTIAQPALYGYNNRFTLTAIAALGENRERGTAE